MKQKWKDLYRSLPVSLGRMRQNDFFTNKRVLQTGFFLLAFFFLYPVSPAWTQGAPQQLARVGFLQFINTKGNPDIAYLGGSISDALAKSMQAKFQYKPVESPQLEAGFQKVVETRKNNPPKTNTNNKDASGATSLETMPLQTSELAEIAKKTGADILIFGQYESVNNNSGVFIATKIYFTVTNAISDFEPEQHPLDSSLFGAIDFMAKSVTEKIVDVFSAKTSVAEAKTTDENTTPVKIKKEEKIALTVARVSENMELLTFYMKNPSSMAIPVTGENLGAGCHYAFVANLSTAVAWLCGKKVTFFPEDFIAAHYDQLYEKRDNQEYFTTKNLNKIDKKLVTTIFLRLKNPEDRIDLRVYPGILHLPEQDTLIIYTNSPRQIPFGTNKDNSGLSFTADGTTTAYALEKKNGNLWLLALAIPMTVVGIPVSIAGSIVTLAGSQTGFFLLGAGLGMTGLGDSLYPGIAATEEAVNSSQSKVIGQRDNLNFIFKNKNEILFALNFTTGHNYSYVGGSSINGWFAGLQYGRYLDKKGLLALRFGIDFWGGSYDGNYSGWNLRTSLSIHPFLGVLGEIGVVVMPNHYGASLGLGYDFILGNSMVIRPMVGADYLIGVDIYPKLSLSSGMRF